ncbi:MAG: cysteine hydrolase [Aigarchaeota archaeon]|nr:cysteine hydrolase [Aigarchaeota archaeon]
MIYEISPKNTALLLIDVQMEYFDSERPLYIPEAEATLANINRAVNGARDARAKVICIRHAHRPGGSDVGRKGDSNNDGVFVEGTPFVRFHPELKIDPADPIVTKRRHSAFEGTDLEQLLRGNSISAVVIAGFMTQFCCASTARSAHDRDFRTLVLSDATAGRDLPDVGFGAWTRQQIQAVTLTCLANGIAEAITTTEFLNRIESGT